MKVKFSPERMASKCDFINFYDPFWQSQTAAVFVQTGGLENNLLLLAYTSYKQRDKHAGKSVPVGVNVQYCGSGQAKRIRLS